MNEVNYENFRFKSQVNKMLIETEYSFKTVMGIEGFDNRFIIGAKLNNQKDLMAIVKFFNAIENTKNNYLLSVNNFLELSDEIILKEISDVDINDINNMLNPYKHDNRNYYFENAIFRLVSLWDQLAHVANNFYELGIEKKSVNVQIFTRKKYRNIKVFSKIKNYLDEENSFFEFNIHTKIKGIRNKLIHYCDMNSYKIMSQYSFDKDSIIGLPLGYLFTLIIYDYIKFIEFASEVYEEFINEKNFFGDKNVDI